MEEKNAAAQEPQGEQAENIAQSETKNESDFREKVAELDEKISGLYDMLSQMQASQSNEEEERAKAPLLPEPDKDSFADEREYERWLKLSQALNAMASEIANVKNAAVESSRSYQDIQDKIAIDSFIKAHPEYNDNMGKEKLAKTINKIISDPALLLEFAHQHLVSQRKTDKKVITTQPSRTPAGATVPIEKPIPSRMTAAEAAARVKEEVLQKLKGNIPIGR